MATPASLSDVLTSALLTDVHDIVFPWPANRVLSGHEVGQTFFGPQDDSLLWDTAKIRHALLKLGTADVDPEELYSLLANNVFSDYRTLLGGALLLDQGPRYLCKHGSNARYIYEYFDNLTLYAVNRMVVDKPELFTLAHWRRMTSMSLDNAVLVIMMLLPPLVHSENLEDQKTHLWLTEKLRTEYEQLTGTRDPYRMTYDQDQTDPELFWRILAAGPPIGYSVRVSDFVYWMMRYYTSHVAFVFQFRRSPVRNIAVGRPDAPGEAEWLARCGILRTPEDEVTRSEIADDKAKGTWRPLRLQ